MAKPKNKRNTKPRKRQSGYYRPTEPSAKFAKRTILIILAILAIAVVAALVSILFFDNEKTVKADISHLASDYYENYFYENLVNSDKYKQLENIEEAFEKYHTSGLSPLTLRDLLLYDGKRNEKYSEYLTRFCDEDNTIIQLYMDPPYDRKSYHAKITYACNF